LYSGIYDAVRGCRIQKLRFDAIASNMANITTGAFKKDVISFDELLGLHTVTDFSQGNIRYTGNPLDVALQGEGFFKVETPAGIRYTRNGRFARNADGVIVTQNGDPVLGERGPILIHGNNVSIDSEGRVVVDNTEVDRLPVYKFERSEYLQKEGLSYYIYRGDEEEVFRADDTLVKGGYLEESNVVIAEEMVKMMDTLRTFESYQKVLQSFDETDGRVINEVGKP